MQAIDILGDQQLQPALLLQSRQCLMGGTGPRLTHHAPAQHGTRPVALTHQHIAHEGLIGHGLGALPLSVAVPVVRDADFGAAAGATNDYHTRVRMQPVLQAPQRQSIHTMVQGFTHYSSGDVNRATEPTSRRRRPFSLRYCTIRAWPRSASNCAAMA